MTTAPSRRRARPGHRAPRAARRTVPRTFPPCFPRPIPAAAAATVTFALALAVAVLAALPASGAALTSWTTSQFTGAGACADCHDRSGSALTDAAGGSVSIPDDWRGTMMAHAFKDPLWRAVMEAEVAARPDRKAVIEDTCQTCHAPLPRTQRHLEGGGPLSFADAELSPLAGEGVGCTLCHQIQPDAPDTPERFSGHYRIEPVRRIFGPYEAPLAMPMQRHVNYTPVHSPHVQDSALCAPCHTLFTPITGPDGTVTGRFPEQTPYLEWQASEHARSGRHCQDCHMERQDEPIKISSRPPWLGTRQPFWRHQFVGGNTFMLRLMADQAKAVEPNATEATLAATIERAREQLRHAARVEAGGRREGTVLQLSVTAINQAGHKFPTGHPYRRAWLHVRVDDARGKRVFESGAPGRDGRIPVPKGGFLPHLDRISRPDQVQIYESVMGDAEGRRTYDLLRAAATLKDNRLPPRGFPSKVDADIAVKGDAALDGNFNPEGRGSDQVEYRIETGRAAPPFRVTVALLYQSVPPEAVAWLGSVKGEASETFSRFYRRADPAPEVVHEQSLVVE